MEPKPYKIDNELSIIVNEPPVQYGNPVMSFDSGTLQSRYTYADYLTWTDNVRRELLDGFAKLMAGPKYIHSVISGNIFAKIWSYTKKRRGKCKVIHAPIDVRLPQNGEIANDKIYTVVQPDICVVCDPSKIDENGIIGAPDLVVEVQSPSTEKYVISTKFDLYEKAGVKEYWVVYPKSELTVFLLQDNGKFDTGTTYNIIHTPDAKVPLHTIQGFEIALKELFED